MKKIVFIISLLALAGNSYLLADSAISIEKEREWIYVLIYSLTEISLVHFVFSKYRE